MIRAAAAAILVIAIAPLPQDDVTWSPSMCRNPAFASQHRDLCGNPILNQGGSGSGECGGLCGVVRDVIKSIPGVGGFL